MKETHEGQAQLETVRGKTQVPPLKGDGTCNLVLPYSWQNPELRGRFPGTASLRVSYPSGQPGFGAHSDLGSHLISATYYQCIPGPAL
jgi:hypothetical protein